MSDERKIYSVFELNRCAKLALERGIGEVWVEGEISRLTRHASGHWYFTLKDANASISCAMFQGYNKSVLFQARDGMQVRVFAAPTIYEPRGSYQLAVTQMEEAGKGSLQEQFERLKAKLAAEGLFDPARKRPIPKLPRCIGVVTSPTGAAIRDILQVIERRFPNMRVILAPVMVQGPKCAQSVAAAIDYFNTRTDVDVLIVGRGGGSAEDLWGFNEEIVAQSIAASAIPLISAVGHEIDFTIADFVSDLRAPTPSAAAELAVPEKADLVESVALLRQRLTGALTTKKLRLNNRLGAATGRLAVHDPRRLLVQYRQQILTLQAAMRHALKEQTRYADRLGALEGRMRHALESELRRSQQRVDEAQTQLVHRMETRTQRARQLVVQQETALRTLSPLAVLERGYSLTTRADGTVVRVATDVAAGDLIQTRVADGEFVARVTGE
jgi:exodeoxyribonuclease VII large subunit